MKLKTEQLKKFLTVAAQIKPNPVAQHLDSIKIECTGPEIIFSKTNQNIWVKYKYECQPQAPEVFLINEKMLNGVIITSKEHEMEIVASFDGSEISITAGAGVLKTSAQDPSTLPAIHEEKGDKVSISKDDIERIRIASKYLSTAQVRTAMCFVEIGPKGIFSTNGSIMYYYASTDLPPVFFDENPLSIIKSTEDVLYWTSTSYDFFEIDGFVFGFVKNIIQGLDYTPIINQTGENFFIIQKQDFIDFCTLVQYGKKQDHLISKLSSKDGSVLNFSYVDAQYNINISHHAQIESAGPIEDFSFSFEWVSLLLKTIPYDNLIFTKVGPGHYKVTTPEDERYIGIIAKLKD